MVYKLLVLWKTQDNSTPRETLSAKLLYTPTHKYDARGIFLYKVFATKKNSFIFSGKSGGEQLH